MPKTKEYKPTQAEIEEANKYKIEQYTVLNKENWELKRTIATLAAQLAVEMRNYLED